MSCPHCNSLGPFHAVHGIMGKRTTALRCEECGWVTTFIAGKRSVGLGTVCNEGNRSDGPVFALPYWIYWMLWYLLPPVMFWSAFFSAALVLLLVLAQGVLNPISVSVGGCPVLVRDLVKFAALVASFMLTGTAVVLIITALATPRDDVGSVVEKKAACFEAPWAFIWLIFVAVRLVTYFA